MCALHSEPVFPSPKSPLPRMLLRVFPSALAVWKEKESRVQTAASQLAAGDSGEKKPHQVLTPKERQAGRSQK